MGEYHKYFALKSYMNAVKKWKEDSEYVKKMGIKSDRTKRITKLFAKQDKV